MKPLLTALRWLVFLPLGFVAIALVQIATGLLAEPPWWVGAPLTLFFGGAIAVGGAHVARWAPHPKVGSIVLASLFGMFELWSLASLVRDGESLYPVALWAYVSLVLVLGILLGGWMKREE